MSKLLLNSAATSVDGEWPERLRRGVRIALNRCQIEQSQWFAREFDVHHIVAAGLDGAAPGRRLLARWSISVHSIVNAAIVPRSFHQGQGLHRQEFLHTINLRLSSAAMFCGGCFYRMVVLRLGVSLCFRLYRRLELSLLRVSEDAAALRLQNALQVLVTRSASAGGSAGGVRADDGGRVTARSGRERFHVSGRGARLESEAVSCTRRTQPSACFSLPVSALGKLVGGCRSASLGKRSSSRR